MKKLLLILTLISLVPQISAMDQDFDPNLSVAETQDRICAENKRILEEKKRQTAQIEASNKKMYSTIFVGGLMILSVAQIINVINQSSTNKQ